MHSKLQAKLSSIKERLSKADIQSFKVGKSENSKERFNYYEGYHFLSVIAKGSSMCIDQAERDLISCLMDDSALKNKCDNENEGGAGNPDATELYIVAKRKGADYNDHLLEPEELLNLNIIKL